MTDTQPLAPTDADIDALWVGQQLTVPQLVQRRVIARAVLAKWGTPPAVAGEPVACRNCGGTGWMVRDPDIGTDQECFVCDGSGRYSESATPQPTQAQAGTPCRKNPFYHGPRNCSRGTVGCCEDHGTATQAQAGAMPRPVTAAEHEVLMAAARDNMTLVAKGRLVESPEEQAADSVLEDAERLTYEQAQAIRQGHEISASDGYFEARPQIDSNDRRKVFQAGFERGWDAARKQGANHD